MKEEEEEDEASLSRSLAHLPNPPGLDLFLSFLIFENPTQYPLFFLELLLSHAFAFGHTLHVTFCGPTATTKVKGGPSKSILSRKDPKFTSDINVTDTAGVGSWFVVWLLISAICAVFESREFRLTIFDVTRTTDEIALHVHLPDHNELAIAQAFL